MPRPNSWIIGGLALLLIFGFVVQPQARVPEAGPGTAPIPVAANIALALGACPTVRAREVYERTDCLQGIRVALLEGRITLAEAVERLNECAASRRDLANLAAR